jgi:O-antigen ligase
VLLALLQYILSTNSNIWAGVSYRPEIWGKSLQQIAEAPWFGHGYDAPFTIILSIQNSLYDPHNIELAILYESGVVGFVLWTGLYLCALRFAWRHRTNAFVLIASAWLIYGLGCGLTEGRAYMSRPKEHWFLIWIPMALVFATSFFNTIKVKQHEHPENH